MTETNTSRKPFKQRFANIVAECDLMSKSQQGHGYKYVGLPQMLKIIRPLLTREGILLTMSSSGQVIFSSEKIIEEKGSGDKQTRRETPFAVAIYRLTATDIYSNEKIEVEDAFPFLDSTSGAGIVQRRGATATYALRYLLRALFFCNSEPDNDSASDEVNVGDKPPIRNANAASKEPSEYDILAIKKFTFARMVERGINVDDTDYAKRLGEQIGKNTNNWKNLLKKSPAEIDAQIEKAREEIAK